MDVIRASYDQPPCQPGPTCRRNFCDVAKSTWQRMLKEELGLRAYKVLNNIVHHKNFQRVFSWNILLSNLILAFLRISIGTTTVVVLSTYLNLLVK